MTVWIGNIALIDDEGDGDSMGSVTDETSKGRFSLIGASGFPVAFGLAFIRGHFTGGSGQENLVIRVDNDLGTRHDYTIHTIENIGTGDMADLNFRVAADDERHWRFKPGDILVLEWANPNTQVWGIEVGLYNVIT